MPKGFDPLSGFVTGLTQGTQAVGNIAQTLGQFQALQNEAERMRLERELYPTKKQALETELKTKQIQQAIAEADLQRYEKLNKFLDTKFNLEHLKQMAGGDEEVFNKAVQYFSPFIKEENGEKYFTGSDILAVQNMFQSFHPLTTQFATDVLSSKINKLEPYVTASENEVKKLEQELERMKTSKNTTLTQLNKMQEKLEQARQTYMKYKSEYDATTRSLATISDKFSKFLETRSKAEREAMKSQLDTLKALADIKKTGAEIKKINAEISKSEQKELKSKHYLYNTQTGEITEVKVMKDGTEQRTVLPRGVIPAEIMKDSVTFHQLKQIYERDKGRQPELNIEGQF